MVGGLFHFQLFILPLFGALIGIPSLVGGVIAHGIGTVFFITVFGGLLVQTSVGQQVTNSRRLIGAGLAYGAALFMVAFGVFLPLVTRIRPVRPLPIPYLPLDAFVVHLIFGLLVGLSFAITRTESRK